MPCHFFLGENAFYYEFVFIRSHVSCRNQMSLDLDALLHRVFFLLAFHNDFRGFNGHTIMIIKYKYF